MNWFEKFIKASIDATWGRQEPFHAFQLTWIFCVLVLSIGLSVFFAWKKKKKSKYALRVFLGVCSILVIVWECWNQVENAFYYDADTDTVTWKYSPGWAPFQFCDLPTLLNPFATFLPDGIIRKSILCFLGTFCLGAGIIIFMQPSSVHPVEIVYLFFYFTYHATMIIIGTILLTTVIEPKHKSYLYALPIFGIVLAIAEILNVSIYLGSKKKILVNFFHISPYDDDMYYPFIDKFWKNQYWLFLLIFILFFCVVAYILLLLRIIVGFLTAKVLRKVSARLSAKNQKNQRVINAEKIEEGEGEKKWEYEDTDRGMIKGSLTMSLLEESR